MGRKRSYTPLNVAKLVRVLFDDHTDRPDYHVVEQYAKPVRTVGRMAVFDLDPGFRLDAAGQINLWRWCVDPR